jgi:hypothetical protein
MIEKHFVTFVSPGTFVPETTTKEVSFWDVEDAKEMARTIIERHGAKPYCFYFTTRRNDGALDSREVRRSCNYFLGGTVLTLDDVRARHDEKDAILISNMECNDFSRVIENCNSWRATLPLRPDDVVLEFEPA